MNYDKSRTIPQATQRTNEQRETRRIATNGNFELTRIYGGRHDLVGIVYDFSTEDVGGGKKNEN